MADVGESRGLTRAQGRRKSEFPARTDVLANAFFDYFVSGVNHKISFTDLLAALNVTGTIVQDGNVLGVPILDTQGSVHNIRNVEASVGVAAAVSVENGLELKTALLPSTGGVQTLINELIAPQLRSLVAGSGISIGATNGNIQISAVAGPPTSSKTVIVDTISDFPTPVGGVITLDPETEYFLINDITTSNRFVMANNSVVVAGDALTITLTYTGVDSMFTSGVANSRVLNIGLNCASGTLLDLLPGGGAFDLTLTRVANCEALCQMASFGSLFISGCAFRNITSKGFVFSGANTIFVMNDVNMTMTGVGTLFALDTATFDVWMYSDSVNELDAAITFLSGAVASANINTQRHATVVNNRIGGTGPITSLAGITPDDDRWGFALNDLIRDTERVAMTSLINNLTGTSITAGVPVKVAGTWTEVRVSGYTTDATGRITSTAEKDQNAVITVTFQGSKLAGGNQQYTFEIAKNGTVITNSGLTVTLSTGDALSASLVFEDVLAPTDFLELFVTGVGTSDDINVNDAQFRVN